MRGQHRRLGSVWGQMPKPEEEWMNTAAEGELAWLLEKLHPSAVFTADTDCSMNFHSISFWFCPGRGRVSRAGGADEQEQRGECCEGSGTLDSVPGSG